MLKKKKPVSGVSTSLTGLCLGYLEVFPLGLGRSDFRVIYSPLSIMVTNLWYMQFLGAVLSGA
jgi:hypothetical protein